MQHLCQLTQTSRSKPEWEPWRVEIAFPCGPVQPSLSWSLASASLCCYNITFNRWFPKPVGHTCYSFYSFGVDVRNNCSIPLQRKLCQYQLPIKWTVFTFLQSCYRWFHFMNQNNDKWYKETCRVAPGSCLWNDFEKGRCLDFISHELTLRTPADSLSTLIARGWLARKGILKIWISAHFLGYHCNYIVLKM